MPLELVFIHGWAFDTHFWDALAGAAARNSDSIGSSWDFLMKIRQQNFQKRVRKFLSAIRWVSCME